MNTATDNQDWHTVDINSILGIIDGEPYEDAAPMFFESELDLVGLRRSSERSASLLPTSLTFEDDSEYDRKVATAVEELLISMEGRPAADEQVEEVQIIEPEKDSPIAECLQLPRDFLLNPFVTWDQLSITSLIAIRVKRLDFKPFSLDVDLWTDISDELAMNGYSIDAVKCMHKWKSLWLKFKTLLKDAGNGFGDSSMSWEYYPALRSFYFKSNDYFKPKPFPKLKRGSASTENKRVVKKKLIETVTIPYDSDDSTNSSSSSSPLKQIQIRNETKRKGEGEIHMEKDRQIREKRLREKYLKMEKAQKLVFQSSQPGLEIATRRAKWPLAGKLTGEDLERAIIGVAHDHCYAFDTTNLIGPFYRSVSGDRHSDVSVIQ